MTKDRPAAQPAADKTPARRKKKEIVSFGALEPLNVVLTAAFVGLVFVSFRFFTRSQDAMVDWVGALVLVSLCILMTKRIAAVVGRMFSGSVLAGPPFNDPLAKSINQKKFGDQAWQLVIHVAMTVWELSLLVDNTWYDDMRTVWIPPYKEQVHSRSLELFYIAELAIWTVTCFSHRFLEAHHKDFYPMFIHHVATIMLILASYTHGYLRFGLIVLYIHDISDIIVDLLKMANYLKLEGPRALFLTETLFATNLVTWAYYRLYIFPTKILRSSWVDVRGMNCGTIEEDFWCTNIAYYQYQCLALLLLQILHGYWFFLFLKIAYRLLTTNAHEAGAEHYEGDSTEDEKQD